MAFLLYLATACGLLALAARAVRPVSLASAAILALLPIVDGGVALVRGSARAPIDIPWSSYPLLEARAGSGLGPASPNAMWDVPTQMIPWRSVVARAYAAGEWPLWNPYAAGGEPLAGAGQSAPYHPLTLLSLLLAPPQALSYLAATKLLFAALAMFLLARELALAETIALAAAAGWAFCGYVHAFQSWPIGFVAGAFPLLVLGARRAVRSPGVESALLLLAGFLWTLLAGHPESALFALTGAGVWFVLELALARGGARAVATGAGAAAAALALSAFFLLPFWDTVERSAEHAMRKRAAGRELAARPLSDALARLRPNLVPFASGLQLYGVRRPAERYGETAGTAFPGGVLLGAAAYGLLAGRRRWRAPLAIAIATGLAIATRIPGPTDLLRLLPLFDVSLRRDAQLWAGLSIVLASGFGLERAIGDRSPRRFVAAMLATGALLGALVALWWPAIVATGLPAEIARRHALWLVLPPFVAALFAAATARPERWLPPVLALVLAERRAETVQLAHRYAAEFYFPRVAPLDALPADGAPYRIASGDENVLPPNYAAVYGIEDLRSYNALTLPRLAEVSKLWRVPGRRPFRSMDLEAPVLAILDVRFALARGCGPPPAAWRQRHCANGVALLEREVALGRAFAPPRLRFGGGAQDRLRWLGETTDFSRLAWLELGGRPEPLREVDNGRCRVRSATGGFRPRLEVSCEEPGWIVVSIVAWPGWRATAGGRELPLAIANHVLLALEAPAGDSAIELAYRPRAFEIGLAISAGTAVVLFGFGIFVRLRRRRPRAALNR